jgi:tryptophan aminotransferase
MTATTERRIEVLKLAHEFDLIILEGNLILFDVIELLLNKYLCSVPDDPYFYLYYGTTPRPPSYFSLEKEVLPETGRVLRFDSFSKILSAGIRIGFASGPQPILSAIERYVSVFFFVTLQPISFRCFAAWYLRL